MKYILTLTPMISSLEVPRKMGMTEKEFFSLTSFAGSDLWSEPLRFGFQHPQK